MRPNYQESEGLATHETQLPREGRASNPLTSITQTQGRASNPLTSITQPQGRASNPLTSITQTHFLCMFKS
jgi:hypothetical protein